MKKLSEFMSLHRKGLSVLGVTAAVCAMFYVINAPQIVGAAAS